MVLVTMPLSQRTRSSPVTRIQPVSVERGDGGAGEEGGELRCRGSGGEDVGLEAAGWRVVAIGILDARRETAYTIDYSGRMPRFRRRGATLRTLSYTVLWEAALGV